MGEVGEVKTLKSSGISWEVTGDLETDTGIWEETNYCLPIFVSLAGAAGWLAVCMSVYTPG